MTQLRVLMRHRPWWGLGFVQRWQEMVMEPPPHATAEDVKEMATTFREAGAAVRIEYGEKAA